MHDQLAHILRQTEESYRGIHPGVEQKSDGWEKWYSQWLLTLVDLESLLGVRPTQATLEKLLLHCDREFVKNSSTMQWADFMAKQIITIVKRHTDNKQQNSIEK